MSRLTFDALAVQAVLAPNEALPLHTIALRAFSLDTETASPVAILRARRACQILKERKIVDISEGIGNGLVVRSRDTEGNSAAQLQAVMALAVRSTIEDADDTGDEE